MLDDLVTALNACGITFEHHGWSRAPEGTYGVWAEDSASDLIADGHHAERGTVVIVDVYTRDDTQTPRRLVEAALNSLPVGWRLDGCMYENITGRIHWQWRVAVYG